ncbi:MAG: helix-turn-helix transcriptional regulator [Henriciella sp.]|nr:helix-turn-helix transcriptional regulator [Henriciella sp.]
MDQSQDTHPEDVVTEDEVMASVGDQLREAREAQGMSLREIATTTRQSLDLLQSLEAMETSHISPTIVRMQAKSYACFLGLPGDEIAAGFSATRSAPEPENMPHMPTAGRSLALGRVLIPTGALCIAALLGGAVFFAFQDRVGSTVEAPIASKLSTSSSVTSQSSLLNQAVKSPELAIQAVRSAWIEVRGSDGTIFRNRKMAAGEVYYPRMGAGWTITVRDAGAFYWTLDDHAIGAVGEDGEALYSESVDAATQRGLAQLSKALAEAKSGSQN